MSGKRGRPRITYGGVSHLARTLALESGALSPRGFQLNFLALSVPDAFARMVSHGEFDAAEMSLASYFAMVAAGDGGFVGLPIFPARYFRHRQIYVREGAAIDSPESLSGGRVGVPDYHQTAAMWVRAFLMHDYGVDPRTIQWVRGGLDRPGRFEGLGLAPPAGIRLEDAPDGRSLGELLVAGELDAVIAPRAPSVFRPGMPVRRLFSDYAAIERAYYRRTGIFPIMHLVVLSREAHARHPSLGVALLEAFVEAKRYGESILDDPVVEAIADPWWATRRAEIDGLFGGDPFPYGVEQNRAVLEAALGYAGEQGLIGRALGVNDLFTPQILGHLGG